MTPATLILAPGDGTDRTISRYQDDYQAVRAAKALARSLRPEATVWVQADGYQIGFTSRHTWVCVCDTKHRLPLRVCTVCGFDPLNSEVPK